MSGALYLGGVLNRFCWFPAAMLVPIRMGTNMAELRRLTLSEKMKKIHELEV